MDAAVISPLPFSADYCLSPFPSSSILPPLRLTSDSRCLVAKQLHGEGSLGRQSQELHQEGTGAGEAFGRGWVCTPGAEEPPRHPEPLCCGSEWRQSLKSFFSHLHPVLFSPLCLAPSPLSHFSLLPSLSSGAAD